MTAPDQFTIRVQNGKTAISLALGFGLCAGLILGVAFAVIGQSGIDSAAVETGIMQIRGKVYRVTEIHP